MTSARLPTQSQLPSTSEPADELRILTVTNRWPAGGTHGGVFVNQLVEAVRRQGHNVDVEVIAQRRGRLDYLLAARRIRRLASRVDYDVVHAHYGLSALSAAAAARVPRVMSLYGSDVNVWWQRWISRLGGRAYDARIYVSRRLAERARDGNGIVIPNGVDFDLFTPGDRELARSSLGASPADRLVLFGGWPQRKVKGWDLFCEVIAELRARGVEVMPVVLTEPGQARQRVVEKMDASDLLLFTSRRGSEGSPTVVKESIAMGLPVVSVDVGDVAELLAGVHPSAVVSYPEGDALPARHQLVMRLADEASAILDRGGRANGRQAHRWLDLDAVASRVIGVYRHVIAR